MREAPQFRTTGSAFLPARLDAYLVSDNSGGNGALSVVLLGAGGAGGGGGAISGLAGAAGVGSLHRPLPEQLGQV